MKSLELGLIVAGVTGAVVLLAMLINLFRQMTRLALAVGAVLALLVVGMVALSLVNWPTLPGALVEITHTVKDAPGVPVSVSTSTGTSAAVTVRRFAMGMLAVVVLGPVGAVAGYLWWQEHQRQSRFQDTLAQAQVYALISGQRSQLAAGMGRRPGQQGGTVIMVGGQQQETVQPVGGKLWEG